MTMAINVIEDITDHKRAEQAQRFLAEQRGCSPPSLDPDELLVEIANLAVPELVDWCAVDLLTDSGMLERKALAHVDPAVRQRAIELSARYPPDPDAPRASTRWCGPGSRSSIRTSPTRCCARARWTTSTTRA